MLYRVSKGRAIKLTLEGVKVRITDYAKALTVWITKTVENSSRDEIPDYLNCLLRNLYACQEATVRTGYGTTDWFQIGKKYIKAVYLTYMQSTS